MKQLRTSIPLAVRALRAAACGAVAVLLAASTLNATNDGAVVSLSVVPNSGRATVVIGFDGNVQLKDFVLRDPDRIVVDISNASLGVRKLGYDDAAAKTPAAAAPVAYVAPVALPAPRREPPRAVVSVATNVPADVPLPTLAAPEASTLFQQTQGPQGERLITITFDNSPVTDVIAQFAAYSRRTIIPAKGVTGNITAEIKQKPWDVALKVVLEANGFGVYEDPNGIMIVNTLENLVARPRLETLNTVTVRFNYTAAAAVAEALRGRLTRDCSGSQGAPGATPAAAASSPLSCPVRGTVTADSLTNSVSITDAPSALEDLVRYARTLDVRQPQVNIKAKIILVDRTQLEGLGLKYDIGSRNQHFNDIVTRTDTAGNAETGNIIFLGGNTVSAIANAAQSVPSAALRIVYSAALGAFDFTTFVDALQEVSVLDVQAEPSVTTLNYRTAILSAGTQVPIRTTEQGAGGNAAGQLPQVTVDFRPTGIILQVTPFITNNRQVKMKVIAENSDVQFVSGDVGAVFPTQRLENELLVADGETAVLGGLTQTSVRMSKTGIPLLVDLPLIGKLFGVTNRQETKRDLLILITPHIVDEGDMSMEPRRQP